MKNTIIKKVTQFNTKDLKVYYIQIGTRMFSLSMPSNFSNGEIKETLKEFNEKIDDAILGESVFDAAYRAVLNKTEADKYAPIDFELDAEIEIDPEFVEAETEEEVADAEN
jgi:hypothetical protein